MPKRSSFNPIRTILVPILYDGPGLQALRVARQFDAHITLVGIVNIHPEQSLSVGAPAARALRKQLRQLGQDARITSKAQIIVAHQPWSELMKFVQHEEPDLLCLEWEAHFPALGIRAYEALSQVPCNLAMVRGELPADCRRVLVPMRGGPHAELALRVGFGLQPANLTALHLRHPDDPAAGSDAPFKGLRRVLSQLPEVHKEFAVTTDPAQTILASVGATDVVIMGTTAQTTPETLLGPVAERVLREAPGLVIAVRTKGRVQVQAYDETLVRRSKPGAGGG
jgi:glucosyl-3-phosphoglycerate synthase